MKMSEHPRNGVAAWRGIRQPDRTARCGIVRWLSVPFVRGHSCHPLDLVAALLLLLATAGLTRAASAAPLVTLRTQTATFGIDRKGSLCALFRNDSARSYLVPRQPSPVLSLRLDGKLHAPDSAAWQAQSQKLTLHYGSAGVTAVLRVRAESSHAVFEVVDLKPADRVELVLWGPYPTTIGEIIGETVGVVRDAEFAVGIQTLNAKTLGGYPTREDDLEAAFAADDHGNYPNLPAGLRKEQGFRGDTAKRAEFGSVLQAFCRDGSRPRVIRNWGHEKYLVPGFSDGGVVGSKIALFACPAPKALETIGAIEVAEGLPHPMIDGVWGKESPEATASYLIVDFGENSISRALDMTKRAGLRYLYHSSPFATWGHFKLKPDLFPNGWDGLRACMEKARKVGVRIGFHTLSNFITPNDSYVTPKPDPRLARIGASELTADLDVSQMEIPVASPDYFTNKTTLNTVMVGEELIRYASLSTQAPWRLLDCQRGAWGSRVVAHARGEAVAKLMDHDYKVFLADAVLSQEVARNIAALCNHSGALQLSFDGLEGNWSTGRGQYGCALFTGAWYDALLPELRGRVINDASGPGHFNWHIYSRMNWGEPWYADFRESQTLYRFKNQVYFERNLMPHMLGWFALGPATSSEDAEWLLARAAGFDAGFALAVSLASTAQLAADPSSADTAKQFGATPAILEAVRQWEAARMAGSFPPKIKAALRNDSCEFHLEPAGEGRWDLFEAHVARFTRDAGHAAATEFQFQNADAAQPLQWIVRSTAKEPIESLTVQINGTAVVALMARPLPPGGSLKYVGGSDAVIADAAWIELARVPVDANAARVGTGAQRVKIGCAPQNGASLKLELRTLSPATRIGQIPSGFKR